MANFEAPASKTKHNEMEKRRKISIDEQQSEKYQSTLISQKEEKSMRAAANSGSLQLLLLVVLAGNLLCNTFVRWHSGNCQRKSVVRWCVCVCVCVAAASENAPRKKGNNK